MQIHYKRNLIESYMIIEQSNEMEDWEKEMVIHSNIPGVLFSESVTENEAIYHWYAISGRQALDTVLEESSLRYDILRKLLIALYESATQLESILLPPEGLLFSPECIFFDTARENITFCYCPRKDVCLSEEIRRLAEYLLAKLDHTDAMAVDVTYRLYEYAVKEGVCLKGLGRLAHEGYGEEAARVQTDVKAESENVQGEEERFHGRETKIQFLYFQKQKFQNFINRILEKTGRKKEEEFVFEPDTEEEKGNRSRPTVLLSDLRAEILGILCYEGDGEGEDLKIKTVPYVIGSDPSCDGHICGSAVSRRHARITKKENLYFIEDLNSANGTYVGGQLLDYRTKRNLEKNEVILFADKKFRFI